jgi:hypothetical protein
MKRYIWFSGEFWKPVEGFQHYYVSNLGNVATDLRRHVREVIGPFRICPPIVYTKYGHLKVNFQEDGKQKRYYVHRIVLRTFIGPPDIGQECCHFPDSNPGNNNIHNLIWGTRKENRKHSDLAGLSTKGEAINTAKLNELKVHIIRLFVRMNLSNNEISQILNVHNSTVSTIKNNQQWKHVPDITSGLWKE